MNKQPDINTLARLGAVTEICTLKRIFPGILDEVSRREQVQRAAHARHVKQTRRRKVGHA